MTDVIVIGAGPAGACHALSAARAGASVLLAGPPPRHRQHTVELLSGRAGDTMARLGVLGLVSRPCAGVLASWGSAVIDKPAVLEPDGGGWIVDRAVLDPALVDAAMSAGCSRVPQRIDAVERSGTGWRVRVAGAWRHADRLVLATGRAGGLCRSTGVVRHITHRMTALVGWADAALPDLGDRLHVAATRDGWRYAIGCGQGTALGLCTDTDLLRTNGSSGLGWHGQRVDTWHRSATTARLVGPMPPGVTIIGDAALAVDPLSGHGLALAIQGAWLSATDPAGYPDWLAEVTSAHDTSERAVYAAANLAGPFWHRRR